MGVMRFLVHDPSRLAEDSLGRVFIAGGDDLPFACRSYLSGNQLVVERREDASGCLWVPWAMKDVGEWLLPSATLMERERPYLLEVELARGTVYRLRNQLAMWEQLGLQCPEEIYTQLAAATRAFSHAATRQDDHPTAAASAEEALQITATASLQLAAVYAEQAMKVRLATTPKLSTLMGVRLGEETPTGAMAEEVATSFSLAAVSCAWKSIEASEGKRRWKNADDQMTWAHNAGLRISCGPLLEFDERTVPEWAYLWEGDVDTISSLMIGHIQAVVKRYRGRVQLWHVAARVNRIGVLSLSDEERLQLTARAVKTVRELDPKTPVVVGFDQPWGEYMATENSDLAPIDFADALERADLGISGFGLELNIGYAPGGTTMRSPMEFSRLLDQWSLRLESPLQLSLTLPSGIADKLAHPKKRVVVDGKRGEADNLQPAVNVDEAFQAQWVKQHLPMLLAKNCVHIVIWNQHRDDVPHEYPNAGLLNATGEAKAALPIMRDLRKKYLA